MVKISMFMLLLSILLVLSSTYLTRLSVKDIVLALMIPILLLLLSVSLTHGYVVGVELALTIILLVLFVSSGVVMVIEGFIETITKMRADTYIRMFSLIMLFLISAFIVIPVLASSELRLHTVFKESLNSLFRFVLIYTATMCIISTVYHIVKTILKAKAKKPNIPAIL
ncbi:MAG: hypothetical protein DRO40_13690 [Thermoprotei archaeon]|nr:MAG: hypothetical protein DRO40_13690 [Thermoprotei archaeon]